MKKLNGKLLEGENLFVKWARFEKKMQGNNQAQMRKPAKQIREEPRIEYRPKMDGFRYHRTFREVLLQPKENSKKKWMPKQMNVAEAITGTKNTQEPHIKSVSAKRCEENLQWLARSMIVETSAAMKTEAITEKLVGRWAK